jgi:Ni,Fe-hydrogenase III component G
MGEEGGDGPMRTEDALAIAAEFAENWMWETETARPEPNRIDITLNTPQDLVPITVGLRVKRLGHLSAITGLDLGEEKGKLELLYQFCAGAAVITLRVQIPREDAAIPSLCEIIPAAEAFERELSEMFGVRVDGLRNPERLYLPEDWPSDQFPLRKDFDPAVIKIPASTGAP